MSKTEDRKIGNSSRHTPKDLEEANALIFWRSTVREWQIIPRSWGPQFDSYKDSIKKPGRLGEN
jgi:hypothetical protein